MSNSSRDVVWAPLTSLTGSVGGLGPEGSSGGGTSDNGSGGTGGRRLLTHLPWKSGAQPVHGVPDFAHLHFLQVPVAPLQLQHLDGCGLTGTLKSVWRVDLAGC